MELRKWQEFLSHCGTFGELEVAPVVSSGSAIVENHVPWLRRAGKDLYHGALGSGPKSKGDKLPRAIRWIWRRHVRVLRQVGM